LRLASLLARAYGGRIAFERDVAGDGTAIERAITEHRPGMIVIGAPRRRLRDLFRPNAVERVLQSAPGPVLVVQG
jgi:nucleotide-binding universal stress UspA family protein